jgi:hypothetical protein
LSVFRASPIGTEAILVHGPQVALNYCEFPLEEDALRKKKKENVIFPTAPLALSTTRDSWVGFLLPAVGTAGRRPPFPATTRKTAIGGGLTRSAYSKWCAAAI